METGGPSHGVHRGKYGLPVIVTMREEVSALSVGNWRGERGRKWTLLRENPLSVTVLSSAHAATEEVISGERALGIFKDKCNASYAWLTHQLKGPLL